MNLHVKETIKRNLEFIMFVCIIILFVLSFILNSSAIMKSKIPIIIGIDANGTRVVTEPLDPIYKTEATRFIQKFLTSIYNFKTDNFVKQIGYATNVMSDELWETKRTEILELKDRIDRDQISIQGSVQKLTKDESGIYFALIDVTEKSRMNQKDHKVKVALKLKVVERTSDNPTGLLVDSYDEEVISN